VGHAAEWTVCTAKKYRFAEERFTVHLDASGYFPLCVRATDHHNSHRPLPASAFEIDLVPNFTEARVKRLLGILESYESLIDDLWQFTLQRF
jgi:hypothetical protein